MKPKSWDVPLFEWQPSNTPERRVTTTTYPLWTERKAALVTRYLFNFLQVTKHGTYIDGFAGPQNLDHPELWAAKQAVELRPPWLRHFHFFELNKAGVRALKRLKVENPERDVNIYRGDFNVRVNELLARQVIGPKEATFCLLDQRTTECHWRTVKALASHRSEGYKFELFYFLAQGWMDRSLKTRSTSAGVQEIRQWWGRDDWRSLQDLSGWERAHTFADRFSSELGYEHARAYPIWGQDAEGAPGRIMYFMIHATDHDAAPRLMRRAYENAVLPGTGLDGQIQLV